VALNPVLVTDTLPEGFQYVYASPLPASFSADNRTINWTLGPIAPGASSIIWLNTSVGAVENGTYYNDVTAVGVPPNGFDVSDSDTAQIGIYAPAINVIKTVFPNNITVGDNATFTLNISNSGSVNITVDVADTLSPFTTFRGAAVPPTSIIGQQVVWENLATIVPGGFYVLRYNATSFLPGAFENNATATGVPPNGYSVRDNDSAIFRAYPESKPPERQDRDMALNISPLCPGDKMVFETSREGGIAVQNAELRIILDNPPYFYTVSTISTDSAGRAEIALSENSSYVVQARKTGYNPIDTAFDFSTCSAVPMCTSDQDCPAPQACVDFVCAPVLCACGQIINHTCSQYECCSDAECGAGEVCKDHACVATFECARDADCPSSKYCDIAAGQSGGSCKDVSGACGQIIGHRFAPYNYECGSESGCSGCAEGFACMDHKCVQFGIACPTTGIVSDKVICALIEKGQPCAGCDYVVTDPSGNRSRGKTDEDGNLGLLLALEGAYKVSIISGGQTVKEVLVQAIPKSPAQEPQNPTPLLDSTGMFWILAILLFLIGLVYWRRRKKKGRKSLAAMLLPLFVRTGLQAKSKRKQKRSKRG